MAKNKSIPLQSLFQAFADDGALSGILLFLCAIVAVTIANVPALHSVQEIWQTDAGFQVGNFSINMTLKEWINDALMAIFFFMVGLEIKQEMLVGELASPKKAMLPIFAALGGMLCPALIYTCFNLGSPSANGWGIPMATDIAFAMGVLAMLGKRCPLGLKVFLTALAIVDDLGSIVVLALFYPTHAIHGIYLLYAGIVFLILVIFNKANISNALLYLIPGVVLWYFVYMSGVHATIAGVLLAVSIPTKTKINEVKFYVTADYLVKKFKNASNGNVDVFANHEQITILNHLNQRVDQINPLICRLQSVLHAPVNYFIMPIFALVNAGVAFGSGVVNDPHFSTIALGIFLGLLCGKPIGIFLFSWISVKLGLANLPDNSNWKQLFAIGIVGGIGFTMSLFIDNLAFVDAGMIDVGKAAILVTSTVAMLVGIFAVAVTSKRS